MSQIKLMLDGRYCHQVKATSKRAPESKIVELIKNTMNLTELLLVSIYLITQKDIHTGELKQRGLIETFKSERMLVHPVDNEMARLTTYQNQPINYINGATLFPYMVNDFYDAPDEPTIIFSDDFAWYETAKANRDSLTMVMDVVNRDPRWNRHTDLVQKLDLADLAYMD